MSVFFNFSNCKRIIDDSVHKQHDFFFFFLTFGYISWFGQVPLVPIKRNHNATSIIILKTTVCVQLWTYCLGMALFCFNLTITCTKQGQTWLKMACKKPGLHSRWTPLGWTATLTVSHPTWLTIARHQWLTSERLPVARLQNLMEGSVRVEAVWEEYYQSLTI